MNILELLKGKKVKVMTDAKVEVELTIESVKENQHSEDVGPRTRENDWYPAQRTWITYDVKFTNGFSKSYSSLSDFQLA